MGSRWCGCNTKVWGGGRLQKHKLRPRMRCYTPSVRMEEGAVGPGCRQLHWSLQKAHCTASSRQHFGIHSELTGLYRYQLGLRCVAAGGDTQTIFLGEYLNGAEDTAQCKWLKSLVLQVQGPEFYLPEQPGMMVLIIPELERQDRCIPGARWPCNLVCVMRLRAMGGTIDST